MSLKKRTRAFRRAAEERVRQRRSFLCKHVYGYSPSEREIGIYSRTFTRCSCPMCGNPRKHFHERSLAERRAQFRRLRRVKLGARAFSSDLEDSI